MTIKLPKKYPVACHTSQVGPGSIFFAIKGAKKDGTQFIPQAIANGATHIIVEKNTVFSSEIQALLDAKKISVEYVSNTRKALSHASAQAADYHAKKLKTIGITGTKGKTTSAYILFHILKTAGYSVALMSTIENRINDHIFETNLTTAQPDYIHQFLALCVKQSVMFVVMEVAAQAVTLHRVADITFDHLIFTNFDREHLEFYDSMDSYFHAKESLLEQVKSNKNIWLYSDDTAVSALHTKYPEARMFGLKNNANITGSVHDTHSFQLEGIIQIPSTHFDITCPTLSGAYNFTNILATVGVAIDYGITHKTIQKALSTLPLIAGRLEQYPLPNGALGIIDYAHNPQSYTALLSSLRTKTDNLIVVFGAGGERDQGRRPQMGTIAAKYADIVVITSDNPRSEDPQTIINQICNGIPKQSHSICEIDRKKAILCAYKNSKKGSIIALLGKGPDEYQIIGNTKTPFSERVILNKLA